MLPQLKAKLTGRDAARCCSSWKRELDLCPDLRGRARRGAGRRLPAARPATAASSAPAISADLDELRDLAAGGKQWIAQYQAERDRADRHPEPEGRLQQGLRLLHRDHQRAQRQDARRLHPQADAQERRALHHARAEGVRREGADGRREGQGAGVRAVPRAARRGRGRTPAGCRRRPPCWPSSTCWRRWPNWPGSAATAGRRSSPSRCCDIVDGRHPVLDVIEPHGHVRAQRHAAAAATTGIDPAHHRPEHGGQEHLHPPGRAADAAWPRSAASCRPREATIGIADRIFARVGRQRRTVAAGRARSWSR